LELAALVELSVLLEPVDPAAVVFFPAPFASIQLQPHPPSQQWPGVGHYPQRIAANSARMVEMALQRQL